MKEVLEKRVQLHLLASEVKNLITWTSLKGEELINTKRSLSYWQKKMGEFGAKMETMLSTTLQRTMCSWRRIN